MDLIFVRCPERLIAVARNDRAFAEKLMHGFRPELREGESIEDIDISRSQDRLYRLIGRPGADWLDSSAPHHDWAGLALSGDEWLHPGVDTGYGTPRYLLSPAVSAIAQKFEPLTEAVFIDLYREGDADFFRDYVLVNFARLRRFYLDAAGEHQAVIVTPT